MSDDFSYIAKRMKEIATSEGRHVDPVPTKEEYVSHAALGRDALYGCSKCLGDGWVVSYEYGHRIERECSSCKNPTGKAPPHSDEGC